MGLNINTFNGSIIDTQALTRVTEQILNPEKQNSVDVSKLDLSKFNRVNLGTDLYAARTNTEMAIQTAKAATDFDVNLSKAFSANVQYLNSAAAQSLFASKDGKVVAPMESTQNIETAQAILPSQNINETSNLNKDKRGSNPFAFFNNNNENEDVDTDDMDITNINPLSGLNIFA